jgi:cytoskeletal protein CcmA (bactofilin family)
MAGRREQSKITQGSPDTVIGVGAVLDGTFEVQYNVRVDGILRGARLATRQALIVGKSGQVRADRIEVGEALISGQVSGALRARQRVYVEAGARFRGTLQTPRLVVEEGALLQEEREE